jgi:hypothetical protein
MPSSAEITTVNIAGDSRSTSANGVRAKDSWAIAPL